MTQLLQKRVAGVAMNSDGQPGASAKVTIRGVSTFGTGGTDSEPLYVVDGLPLGSTTASTGDRAQPSGTFNPIRDINPSDIERSQVLKDAWVSAAINNGELIIAVVNRHRDKAISTDVLLQEGSFDGNFRVYEVNGPDVKTENDFTSEKVDTKEKASINAKGQKITYSFPAHSFTF